MLQEILSDTLRCGNHIARYELLGDFIFSLQGIVGNPAVQFGEHLFLGGVGKQREHILGVWKIQCKLPPKTKRFCPLVLK